MSIKDFGEKINPFGLILDYWRKMSMELKHQLFLVVIILLVGSSSFGLGRLSALEENNVPLQIRYPGATTDTIDHKLDGAVIGSKNSKKYFFPWCGSATKLLPENKVTFASEVEAKNAGYVPAANCAGLK